MNTETFVFSGFQGQRLSATLWLPDGEPRVVLQIAHGMTEHIGRYTALAQALTQRGFVVAGFDLRGHGRNPGNAEIPGYIFSSPSFVRMQSGPGEEYKRFLGKTWQVTAVDEILCL